MPFFCKKKYLKAIFKECNSTIIHCCHPLLIGDGLLLLLDFILDLFPQCTRKMAENLNSTRRHNQPRFDSFSNLVKMPLTTCWHFSSLLCTVFNPPSLPPPFDFFFGWVAVAKVVMRICSSQETCPPFLVPVNLPTNTAQTKVTFCWLFLPKTAHKSQTRIRCET